MKKIISIILSMIIITSTSALSFAQNYEKINKIPENNIELKEVKNENINRKDVGGGPSPSGAWEFSRIYKKTFTKSQLKNLKSKINKEINSNKFKAGEFAYKVSKEVVGSAFNIPSSVIELFGKTYFEEIKRSATIINNAANKNKSVTLRVKEYKRLINGQKIILFY